MFIIKPNTILLCCLALLALVLVVVSLYASQPVSQKMDEAQILDLEQMAEISGGACGSCPEGEHPEQKDAWTSQSNSNCQDSEEDQASESQTVYCNSGHSCQSSDDCETDGKVQDGWDKRQSDRCTGAARGAGALKCIEYTYAALRVDQYCRCYLGECCIKTCYSGEAWATKDASIYTEIVTLDKGNRYEIKATITKDVNDGELSDTIVVKTNVEQQPEIEIPLYSYILNKK